MRSIPQFSRNTCRSSIESPRHSSQRGQSAVEFVFVLVVVVAGMAGLYQVLHFERDVFNRLLYLRQIAMRQVHVDQDTTKKTFFTVGPVEFRTFGELLRSPVPLQVIDPSLRYSAKTLKVRRGTRYYDPYETGLPSPFDPLHDWLAIGGVMAFSETSENSPRWRKIIGPWSIVLYPDLTDQIDQ